ncbi:MAG: ZIP family metal transporter [Flavobacteriales bacterium]|nr:MAG: ZIP family metal transporter [Flavobacteriales bacterium]
MSFSLIILGLISSVLFGGLIVSFLNATNNSQMIKFSLAFSGGFLLAIIFEHLLPDIYHGGAHDLGLYILFGFLIQLILEYFSGGIEHGHVHVHKGQSLPWALFISLSIHSVIEGLPLGNQYAGMQVAHQHVHESLFWGIIFHQIPVAIALMTLLMNTKLSRLSTWIFLFLFASMTPLGVLLGLKFTPEQFGLDLHIILAVVVGMFLHISTTIIFETSENHKFNLLKLTSILFGCGLALLLY